MTLLRWMLIVAVVGESTTGGRLWAQIPQEPSFSRHVVPVFSKLGCNMEAC